MTSVFKKIRVKKARQIKAIESSP
ncbi:hypothetical protein NB311A_19577 [Nitrobacter sp. Nb-311A]|nr:hypothetical protein NB311A_19577 [Nitrobacter sp. Nb-311A]